VAGYTAGVYDWIGVCGEFYFLSDFEVKIANRPFMRSGYFPKTTIFRKIKLEMADWFRRITWTKEDETEYFAKLKRARQWSRPQYLFLQAFALTGTGNPKLLDVAESLIQKLFTDNPDDKHTRSGSLELLGDIYRHRGETDAAIAYYKQAIDFEKSYPNVQGPAFLKFSELVVKLEKHEYFPFLEELLSDKIEKYPFPIYKYKIYAILSIINKTKGDNESAERFATLAKEHAAATTSGFRYHPTVGVVTELDNDLEERLDKK
jgi:tetratricopeptide (TPR) repeat protein